MIDVKVISTGSKGNAVFLDGQILIDCGVPFSKLADAGVVGQIKYIFLTHQHKDHLNVTTLKRLLFENPLIRVIYNRYLVKPIADSFHCSSPFLFINRSFLTEINKWYAIGDIRFGAVPLHHDVPNCAWKIHFMRPQGIFKVIYATDTANLDGVAAKGYDLFLVEANYDKEELIERIKEKRENGQYVYEDRVFRTHLSRQQCDEFIVQNMSANSRCVYLHQHEERSKEITNDNSGADSNV